MNKKYNKIWVLCMLLWIVGLIVITIMSVYIWKRQKEQTRREIIKYTQLVNHLTDIYPVNKCK